MLEHHSGQPAAPLFHLHKARNACSYAQPRRHSVVVESLIWPQQKPGPQGLQVGASSQLASQPISNFSIKCLSLVFHIPKACTAK